MSFEEDLAAAKAARPEPVVVSVAVGDSLYGVEVKRLDGMQWAEVMASAPPNDEAGARLGYDTSKAALAACRKYSRLLDGDGEPVDMSPAIKDGKPVSDPWRDMFTAISGTEIGAIAATWWALNAGDPNKKVIALKKARAAGSATS